MLDYTADSWLEYISVVDSGVVWIAGGDTNGVHHIYKRSSNGTWDSVPTNGIPSNHGLNCVAGKDFQTAWVATLSYVSNAAYIYKTTNGGQNWVAQLTVPISETVFYGIQFSRVNPSYGYAWCGPFISGGNPLKIFKTTDSGNSWNEYSVSIDSNYIGHKPSIWVTDSNHAWFNIERTQNYDTTRILYTLNGGTSFQITKLPILSSHSTTVAFKNDNLFGIAVASGQPNYYLKTFNGGLSWSYYYTALAIGDSQKIIWIPNTTTWYAVTNNFDTAWGKPFYKSTNDGNGWFEMQYPYPNDFIITYMDGVLSDNKAYVYAMDWFGKIYRLAEEVNVIGIVKTTNEIPSQYNLYQNYPNPFNPSTKIRFNIPSLVRRGAGVVELKIYNVLGQRVTTLVNEELSPGSYEVTWDALNYSSGVYFYKLAAEGFTQSRKMILIK